MYDIGRICVKLAGRDAGKKCVIIDVIDNTFVLIDGQTRRRKVNINHIEPTKTHVKIEKNASNKDVVTVLKKHGIECSEKKESKKQSTTRPKKQRKAKETAPSKKGSKVKKDKKDEKKFEKVKLDKAETKETSEKKPAVKDKKSEDTKAKK